MLWDIFCHVVDNYGDIGVSWRLARQLAARGHEVRFWTDDAGALDWMAPQGAPGVQVHSGLTPPLQFKPGDVVVSAFDSPLAQTVVDAIARVNTEGTHLCTWIQLEYLSAQSYVATSHGLASPVHGGAHRGIHKWFFFPGFEADSGGLLREAGLEQRRAQFDRVAWLRSRGIADRGEKLVSLFCYEPAALRAWFTQLGEGRSGGVRLLVTAGRATQATQEVLARMPVAWNSQRLVEFTFLDHMSQDAFDELLWACDCNFVRGEDSLVRALWAGAAFVWHIYPQADDAHRAKLDAFLDWMGAPASLRAFHAQWNRSGDGGTGASGTGELPEIDFPGWQIAAQKTRESLLAQDDLVTRLLRFIDEKR